MCKIDACACMDGAGIFQLDKIFSFQHFLNGVMRDDAVTVEVDVVLAVDAICGRGLLERYSNLNYAICWFTMSLIFSFILSFISSISSLSFFTIFVGPVLICAQGCWCNYWCREGLFYLVWLLHLWTCLGGSCLFPIVCLLEGFLEESDLMAPVDHW